MNKRSIEDGTIFKFLTVMHHDKEKQKYYCICVCGKGVFRNSFQLNRNESSSCGCQKIKHDIRKNKLEGKIFGYWTVLNYLPKNLCTEYTKTVGKYLCECVCGNQKEIVTSSLTRGHTKSCGCMTAFLSSKTWEETEKVKGLGAKIKKSV